MKLSFKNEGQMEGFPDIKSERISSPALQELLKEVLHAEDSNIPSMQINEH